MGGGMAIRSDFLEQEAHMPTDFVAQWLAWARELQAMSQTGLTYSRSHYDTEKYTRCMEIAAEITALASGLPAPEVTEGFRVQPGYATVKVDVRGAVVRDGKILLVQERQDGRWAMPGGWADVGELPSAMVAREVWEESGFEVRPHRVVGVFDANRGGRPLEFFHAYKLVFLCELLGGEARLSEETTDVGFFAFDELPPLSEHRTNRLHLGEVQKHLADAQQPVYFD